MNNYNLSFSFKKFYFFLINKNISENIFTHSFNYKIEINKFVSCWTL